MKKFNKAEFKKLVRELPRDKREEVLKHLEAAYISFLRIYNLLLDTPLEDCNLMELHDHTGGMDTIIFNLERAFDFEFYDGNNTDSKLEFLTKTIRRMDINTFPKKYLLGDKVFKNLLGLGHTPLEQIKKEI